MPSRRRRAALMVLAFVCCLLALAPGPSAHAAGGEGAGLVAGSTVLAFPAAPAEDPADPAPPEEDDGCSWYDLFCAVGSAAGELVTDVWITAMMSLWGAGLWVLGLAFGVIDALTAPDLSADGPLGEVYPVTFGIGAALAALMALVQVGLAAFRRDGESLGKILVGIGQFGIVWLGYIAIAVALVTGVSGMTTGLLQELLDIDNLAAFEANVSTPEQVTDATVATVLGLSAIFLLFPASAAYLLLMLVREAALMLLAATSAISAGGLLAETSRAWFWKSLRWFISALLIAPVAVLILGIGVSITEGVVGGDGDEAEIGMAIVGCLLILIGAICPLILFKLLAFVDPGTSSGVAMRQSLHASGGVLGLAQSLAGGGGGVKGASAPSGGGVASSGAAAKTTAGRAQGESAAEGVTGGRFAGALRVLAAGSAKAGQVAGVAASAGSDVLSMGGVGHTSPYYAQPGPSAGGRPRSGGRGGTASAPTPDPPPPAAPAPPGPGSDPSPTPAPRPVTVSPSPAAAASRAEPGPGRSSTRAERAAEPAGERR